MVTPVAQAPHTGKVLIFFFENRNETGGYDKQSITGAGHSRIKNAQMRQSETVNSRIFLRYNQEMKSKPRLRALKLAAKVKEQLTGELGQPVRVILFGSQARGNSTRFSDIDLFVVLPSLDDRMRLLVSRITWEVGFEAGKIISAIPTTPEKMEKNRFLPLYRNVEKEGIPV